MSNPVHPLETRLRGLGLTPGPSFEQETSATSQALPGHPSGTYVALHPHVNSTGLEERGDDVVTTLGSAPELLCSLYCIILLASFFYCVR